MPRLHTGDVVRFWQAFDHLDDPDAEAHLERLYLTPGTPGLRAFLPGRIRSAPDLLGVLRNHRAFYESVRTQTMLSCARLTEEEETLRRHLGTHLPEALDREVYVVIGALNSGGTLGQEDGRPFAVIGLEFFSGGPHAQTGSLDDWQRRTLWTPDALPGVIAHELVHTLQPLHSFMTGGRQPTLLEAILAEGTADYLGELLSGQNLNAAVHVYGRAHEATLRERLRRDLESGGRVQDWLYQGNDAQHEPADLGYFMGSRIVQAYHARHANRPDVLRELLHRPLTDAAGFTHDSGYFD